MGTYRAPGQVIDRSYEEANKQIAGSINKYDKIFAIKKEEQRLQMEKNEKLQEKIELNRVNGYDKFNAEVRRVTPEGGFVDNMTPFVENLADEYASLYGKTDPASLKRMNQIMSIPQQAADGQGAMAAIDQKYSKSLGLDKDAPNSINTRLTNHENWSYVDSYHDNDGQIIPNEVGGRLQWKLGESNLNNSVFVNGALEGQDFLKYNGDALSVTDPIVESIMTDLQYENAGVKIVDKTNPKLHTTKTSFKQANDKFRERISDPKLYEPILKNQRTMESFYGSQLLGEVVAIAEAEGKDSEAAKLLYGKDGIPYNEDDPEGIWDANKEGGPWVGSDGKFKVSDTQRKIATMGLIAIASSDHYLKPDEVENQETHLRPTYGGSGGGGNSSGSYNKTQLSKINNAQNEKAYKDNLKFSNEIADMVKESTSGGKLSLGNRIGAIEKLAKQLNKINKLQAKTQDPEQKGTYMYDKELDGLVFKVIGGDNDGNTVDYSVLSLTDPNEVNKFLTVNSGMLDEFVYDHYANKQASSGSGSGGIGSRYNCGKGKKWDAKLNKCV